ncbi:NADH-dependent flavin oxidoreductase [Tumebacillus sp. ITR2]|uniref:NADH-dependent flavin oxidoreductase n=1 Tax=Tumebacillus amylolyticus TaxID=2801339 RepID=A0ABS1J4H9_9BACL|nr:NADH-dependent flavin oxidoreductase [Tumebacillus amylolyticus]MBL0385176.1 NADH-dependent flavin oxidoreductase [Tumebacillus amylolyticus]
MNDKYQTLFQPVQLPVGIELKNRIAMAPMTIISSNPDGSVTDAELAYYARRSGGVGMVITAAAKVVTTDGTPGILAADRDELIPSLRQLATTIKGRGARAVLQIIHTGRKAPQSEHGPVAPSAVTDDVEGAVVPRELTDAEIREIVQAFGQATRRAMEAGFDGVELHGANGYLLQQFFSPFTNRREDHWGGTLEKRLNFPLAVIEEVKKVVQEHAREPFIVGYRFSPEEPETPGITMAETLVLADTLAEQNLDYLHVSLHDFWSEPRRGVEDTRSRMEILHERVGKKVPLMGVGNIFTADDAAKALQTGVPLLALGRELILEPDWVEKITEGREHEIKTTLSLQDQARLQLPDPLWNMIQGMKGWFPIEE